MKGIPTLIKLAKREMDQIRKKLSVLFQQKEALELLLANLLEEMRQEEELATKDPALARFFGTFIKKAKIRRDAIRQGIKDVDKRISDAEDELYDAFSSLKKLEIAKAMQDKRKAEKLNAEEVKFLDELASNGFVRSLEDQAQG